MSPAIGEICVPKDWFQMQRERVVVSLSVKTKLFWRESREPLPFLIWSAVLWAVYGAAVVGGGVKIPSSVQVLCN